MRNNTPYPGIEVSKDKARPIIDLFIKKFRKNIYENMPDNVPTSCALVGMKDTEVFSSDVVLTKNNLYVLFEEPYLLLKATGKDVYNFYSNKEPWEDHDFCVFDEALEWCIGVTHNNDVVIVGGPK